MEMIADKILARIYGKGRGYVFTPKDFLDLASHMTSRSALNRLVRKGTIRRLMRGLYEYPGYSKLLDGPASPDPDAIARAIARAHGWTILPSGETALNLLGLSTQVPAAWEYLSDGPSKTYAWCTLTVADDSTVAFKHRANKEITKLSPKTALVIQALKAIGEKNVNRSIQKQLRKRLSDAERRRAVREARYATSWVYEVIKRLATVNRDD